MRVVQIANGYLNNALYSKLFEALKKAGIENLIFVPVKNGVKIKSDDACIYPCFSQLDRGLYYSKQKKIIKGLENTVDLKKVDIVHAHTLFSAGYSAWKLKEKYHIPYIVAVRNTDLNVFFKRAPYLRETGIRVMREAEKVIFLSPAYQTRVIHTYVPKNIRDEIYRKSLIIPNGISDIFLKNCFKKERINKKDVKLIYVGEINQNKNLKETIKAVSILKERGYKIFLIVVGAVTDSKCKALIEEDCVEYHEKCDQEQLIEYYRKADIFVMPSHTETFGLVYAEAMSQGLPVLYTKGQGFDGYFEDGQVGYAISDKDAGDLADKIVLVLRQYNSISANCIEEVKRFDWDLIGKEYCSIYNTAVMSCKNKILCKSEGELH